MKKKIYGIAAALAITMGCSLFASHPVQAANITTSQQQEDDGYFILPNGEKFQTVKVLKNGKTLKYYDIEADAGTKLFSGKIEYNGEKFYFQNYSLMLNKADIENFGYDESDKNTQQFRVYKNPETYFPALTATKKVNYLINKYEAPSARMLPKYVDKTSKVYKEMETAAKETTKNCKTDYEKITTITDYVHSVMTYDISKSHVV